MKYLQVQDQRVVHHGYRANLQDQDLVRRSGIVVLSTNTENVVSDREIIILTIIFHIPIIMQLLHIVIVSTL